MAIEIVDFPIKNGGSFHCYVSSPEGKPLVPGVPHAVTVFLHLSAQFPAGNGARA